MKLNVATDNELFIMLDLSYKMKSADDYYKLDLEQKQFIDSKIDEIELEIAKRNIIDEWKNFLDNKYKPKKNMGEEYLNFLDGINNRKTFLI